MVVATYIQNLQYGRTRLETLINNAVTLGGECCCCCDGGGGGGGGGSGGGGHVHHTEPAGRESQAGNPHQWCRNIRWEMFLLLLL